MAEKSNFPLVGSEEYAQFEKLVCELYSIGAIKFGKFTLKCGKESNLYIDLRLTLGYPKLADLVACFIWLGIPEEHRKSAQLICGVPYGSLHYTTILSQKSGLPMILKRKEIKNYGEKKLIEGNYTAGQTVIVIEDTVSTGGSVFELCQSLQEAGLKVISVGAFFSHNLQAETVSSQEAPLVALAERSEGKVPKINYILDRQLLFEILNKNQLINAKSYLDRANLCSNPAIAKLMTIMHEKKSNLAVSLDNISPSRALEIVAEISDLICMAKVHINSFTFESWDQIQEFIKRLKELSIEKKFMILEDAKFGDIANIVKQQITASPYKINEWADFITVHAISGPDSIKILGPEKVFLVGQMSTSGTLTDLNYINNTINMGQSLRVAGYIAQRRIVNNPEVITIIPAVSICAGDDTRGQIYRTPRMAIATGADVIVSGREITLAHDPRENARVLRDQAWEAYILKTQVS